MKDPLNSLQTEKGGAPRGTTIEELISAVIQDVDVSFVSCLGDSKAVNIYCNSKELIFSFLFPLSSHTGGSKWVIEFVFVVFVIL